VSLLMECVSEPRAVATGPEVAVMIRSLPLAVLTRTPNLLADSFRAAAAANRSAHLAGNQLSFRKYAQKILAQDLANVLFAVAAL